MGGSNCHPGIRKDCKVIQRDCTSEQTPTADVRPFGSQTETNPALVQLSSLASVVRDTKRFSCVFHQIMTLPSGAPAAFWLAGEVAG